jgi:hypothetical protein
VGTTTLVWSVRHACGHWRNYRAPPITTAPISRWHAQRCPACRQMRKGLPLKLELHETDVLHAVRLFTEATRDDPDATVSFGTISNDQHAVSPFGAGYCVSVGLFGEEVFAKSGKSMSEAMERALERLRRKAAGAA